MRASRWPVACAAWWALVGPLPLSGIAVPAPRSGVHAQPDGAISPSFDTLRARAERARSEGRFDEALSAYQAALVLDPAWVEGHWYVGTISYETERYAECRDAFERVVRLQDENGAAWGFKGLCAFQRNDYAAALSDLARARELGLGESPDLVAVVRFHHAMLLTRAGQYERALQELAGFGQQGHSGEDLTSAFGLALLRIPRVPSEVVPEQRDMVLEAGRAALLSVGRDNERALGVLARLVERHPDAPNVHYAYGLLLSSEHPDEALAQFGEELRVSPDHAMARVYLAQELLKRAEHDAARPLAEAAVRLAPDNFMARRVLGQLRLEAGDAPEAIAELETAKALQPHSPSVRFHLARAYRRAQRLDDAVRERAEFTRLERELRAQRGGAHAVGGDPEATGGPGPRP
jgi:tetratricopeptide (TPR) repeat protein